MGITSRMPAGLLRNVAQTHPRLRAMGARLAAELHIPAQRTGALLESLLVHVVEELADNYFRQTTTRLRRIETIRGRIADAVDHVVTEGRLPSDLDHAGLSRLFEQLQDEMAQLRSARQHAQADPPRPTLERITGTIEPAAAAPGWQPFRAVDDPTQGLIGPRPPGVLRDAMVVMRNERPARAALFDTVLLRDHGDLLGLAVLAETETMQQAALLELRAALGADFTHDQWNELAGAVEELGIARHRASLESPAAATARAQRFEDLPPALLSAIGRDRTILGPLAEQDPAGLLEQWQTWQRNGASGEFRAYVYSETPSWVRPTQAEWQAAFDLGSQHGVTLLKDPARYDPNMPNLRTVNPREGGTDLLGLRNDGEIWYVDDKSQRVPRAAGAAGATGINLSSVSAFEGRRFIANIRDDVAELEAGFQRARAQGIAPEPRAVEACERLRRAADALDAATAGWNDADFAEPARRQRIAALLASPEYGIRLFVTSTMGDVTGVTPRLGDLGIGVLPPFVPNPTRATLP